MPFGKYILHVVAEPLSRHARHLRGFAPKTTITTQYIYIYMRDETTRHKVNEGVIILQLFLIRFFCQFPTITKSVFIDLFVQLYIYSI